MFISRDEYIRLKDKEKLNDELEKEIKKLEYLLNTRERTCKIGPWCIKCSHWTKDYSEVISQASDYYTMEDAYYGIPLPVTIGEKVGYCNKYIHDLCPDILIQQDEVK